MDLLRLLAGTIVLRPYVFVFFAVYLFLAVTKSGWKRTVIYTIIAYIAALTAEYSSSHGNLGIPFGIYRYIEATRDRELWIAGVPLMDSLSFSFLSYISYQVACMLLSPVKICRLDFRIEDTIGIRRSWFTTILAAFLMMSLDIVIDPVTLQGKRWFLGEIYYYPDGGSYFGVTIANFAGWFLLCLFILRIYLFIEKRLKSNPARGVMEYRFKGVAPVGVYFGILGFNLFITFYIGETTMGLAGLSMSAALALVVIITIWREYAAQKSQANAHMKSEGA